MNKWDDYLSSSSSKTISGTSDKFSSDEVEIKENIVPENARCVLDDILKEADQLIYDLDDVPLFDIEAAEISLMEDIRQHFEIDSEENRLIEEIRRHFGIDTNEDSSIEDVKCRFGVDSEESSVPEGIRQHLEIDAEESISVDFIKPGFGTDEGENNSAKDTRPCSEIDPPDENTLERYARDVLNNILMKIEGSVSFGEWLDDEGLLPDKYEEVPLTLSNKKSKNKSLFLKKWKSVEFQPLLHSTNFKRNDTKIEKRVYRDEPCTSVECTEKRKRKCSSKKTKRISSVKTRGTVSWSNTPHVNTSRKAVKELFPSFSAKNGKNRFNWRQCTELLLDEDNVGLDMDREICRNEFNRPDKHFEKKAGKYSVTKNKNISTEQNEETIQRKSDASSSASFKVTASKETVEKTFHSLKAKFPEKPHVSLPIPSDVIVSKETVEKTCHPSKVKTSPNSEILFPTSFKVTNSRETAQETCHSFNAKHLINPGVTSPTPLKVTDFKEFLTKDKPFDWQKWLEEYDSDEDDPPPLPKCRVIKRDRLPKNICNRFLCLFTFCLCISTERRKKKSKY